MIPYMPSYTRVARTMSVLQACQQDFFYIAEDTHAGALRHERRLSGSESPREGSHTNDAPDADEQGDQHGCTPIGHDSASGRPW